MRCLRALIMTAVFYVPLLGCSSEQMVRDADNASRYSSPRTVAVDLFGYDAKRNPGEIHLWNAESNYAADGQR